MYPLSVAPEGVATTTALASIGSLQGVRWDSAANAYQVTFDGVGARIGAGNTGNYAQVGDLIASDGSTLSHLLAWTGYSYTRIGHVDSSADHPGGSFAFGLSTASGSVPTIGSATYDATIDGHAGAWDLYGTAFFQFDFGAGTLSGYMDPHTNGPMESPALPRYTFTETVFAPGSTTFSGSFDVKGPTPSSFKGQFNGPHADELMASFKAPFQDWDAQENPTVWGVMEGVIAGKKH